MAVDPISLAFAAKAAPIILPLASVYFKSVVGTDSPILSAFADLGLNLAAGTTGPTIEKFLSSRPDLVHQLTNQHFIRYTGDVLAALIRRFAEQPHMKPHRKVLLELAKRTPEGWLTFIRRGAPGLKPLRHDEFLRTLAQSMDPQAPKVDLASVPFMTFFKWHVRLRDDVAGKLDAYLKSYLPDALHAALVSDDPSAQKAYREAIHREVLSLKSLLHQTQQQLQQQGEKLDDLRDSPGFDLASYARKLRDHCELIPLSDKGGTDTRDRISLSSVFVAPSVRAVDLVDPDHLDLDTEAADAAQRGKLDHLPESKLLHAEQLRDLHRDQPARPALDIIGDPEQRGMILLGDAGVGKTSLVRHFAIEWAQACLDQSPDRPIPPLPLLIELRRFATEAGKEAGFHLLDYLHRCDISIERLDRSWCRHYLESGAAMLILDGLDEVTDHQLRQAIANDATRMLNRGVKILLTSRRVGFIQKHWPRAAPASDPSQPPPSGWQRHLLQEFDDDQRDLFIQKTHALLYPNEAQRQEKTQTFRNRLARYPAIDRLTRNPLLLTLAALLHRTGALGDNRVDLYAAASELLLDTWELVRTEAAVPAPGQNLPPLLKETKVRIVRRLARKIIESPDSQHLGENLFPVSLLQDAVREVIDPSGSNHVQAEAYADLMPRLLRERHSLLCWAGEDQYSFIHRSFLEFFAAQAWAMDKDLARLSPADIEARFLLGPNAVESPRWRDERFQNIIPLYYGQLSDDRSAERLPLLWNLQDEEAPGEAVLCAAACFIEVKAREEHHEFDQQLRQRLLNLAETKWEQANEWDPETQPNRYRCRGGVRALVQLWGASPEIQRWLIETMHQSHRMTTLRQEVVARLCGLLGPTESLLTELKRSLVTARADERLLFLVCRTIAEHWGQTVLFDSFRCEPKLRSLERLHLSNTSTLTQAPSVADFPALKMLSMIYCTGLKSPDALRPLTGASKLESLFLDGCSSLTQVPCGADLPSLELLSMDYCTGLQGVDVLRPLAGMEKLLVLYMDGCTGLTQAPSGNDLPALRSLHMQNCTGLQGLDALRPLAGMTQLRTLHLEGCTGLAGEDVPALMRELGLTCQVFGP